MRAVDLIEKKRNKEELSKEEISFLLNEYLKGNVPDYQMSAFLMATYFNDMTASELLEFTMIMRDSGDTVKFDDVNKFLVDKHSTGGVGDKVTVVLAPILSALGMGTTKLSGKGLGHTGGTIDKFEAIEGFKFSNTREEVVSIANKTGIGLMGYSDKIVPLDKKLYSLRDVTGTVPSIPLIASSIMSKKLAIQSDVIILDVKVGDGAFMKDISHAKELAKRMIEIGKGAGRQVKVVLSNMDEPLGYSIGNANEIVEAIETLKGNGPEDLKEVVYTIALLALKAKGEIKDLSEGKAKIDEIINNRTALEKLSQFITESGGNGNLVNDYTLLPQPKEVMEVFSEKEGYISKIKAEEIGKAAMIIGAGRATKEDVIDHAVGIKILKKVGDKVNKNEKIAEIYYNDSKNVENSKNMKSTDITAAMKMEQKNSTNPAGVSMEASGNISLILEPNLTMKMDLVIPFANNKLSMYVKDDYYYLQNPNDNQWTKQSSKGFAEQFKKAYAQSNALYDFLVKNIDKIDLKEKAGNYILTIKDFKEILKNESSVLDPTGKGLDGFEDMVISFTVDKKTFLPVNVTMTGTINEGPIKMNFSFDLKYSNINNVKEIIVPKEALEAKETLEVLEEQVKEAEKAQKDTKVDKK